MEVVGEVIGLLLEGKETEGDDVMEEDAADACAEEPMAHALTAATGAVLGDDLDAAVTAAIHVLLLEEEMSRCRAAARCAAPCNRRLISQSKREGKRHVRTRKANKNDCV